jgi:hypothetical protein
MHHARGHGHRIVDRVVAVVLWSSSLCWISQQEEKKDQCPMQCRVLRAGK